MSISDDEVEAALNAWWGGNWPDASDGDMQGMRKDMRDALSAAAKVRAIREGDGEDGAYQRGEIGRCEACDKPMRDGDQYYADHVNGGELHAACIGPERESFTDGEGNPLPDGAPIPAPSIWRSGLRSATVREVLEAVAHIGVDFGYGPYVLEDKFIEAARALAASPIPATGGETS